MLALLDSLCLRHRLPLIPRKRVVCAMRLLSPLAGKWDAGRSAYRKAKLGGNGAGDGHAVSGCPRCGGRCQNDDCRAALGLRRGLQAGARLMGLKAESG